MKQSDHLFRKPYITAAALSLSLILWFHVNVAQTTIQLGSISSNTIYTPINAAMQYSYSQQLYTAAEMSAAGASGGMVFRKIRFYFASTNTSNLIGSNSWTIYLGNTAQPNFTGTAGWIPVSTLTPVFSGIVSATPIPGMWFEILFTTPFVYTGNSLVVAVDENSPSASSNYVGWGGFYTTAAPGPRVLEYNSNTINPDPAMPGTANFYSYDFRNVIQLVSPPPPCTGLPNPGATQVASTAVCANDVVNLTLANALGSNVSYQWLNSTDGGYSWTSFGSNLEVAIHSPVVATQYKCRVTCLGFPSVFSDPVSVSVGGSCCSTYSANYPQLENREEITLVSVTTPFGTMSNSSTCTTVAPGGGSILRRYGNYAGNVNGPVAQIGQSVNFSLTQYDCSNSNFINFFQIYVDWNQDQIFQDTERMYHQLSSTSGNHTETGTFTVPLTAANGITRMRVVNAEGTAVPVNLAQSVTFSYGETEDYCFTVIAPPCSGIPNPGNTIVTPSNLCSGGGTVNLSLSNATAGAGVSYQWQYSINGGTFWNNFGSGTETATHTTAVATQYRCIVTCTGSTPAISGTVSVDLLSGSCCGIYSSNYASSAGDEDITNVTITTPNGVMSNSSYCNTLAPGPGSVQNRYSNYAGHVNSPVAQPGQIISFSLTATECSGYNYSNIFQMYVDWNQDHIFQNSECVFNQPVSSNGNHTETGTFTIPLNALNGTTRMRVVNIESSSSTLNFAENINYVYGETEDYCFTVIAPPCAGQPNPGNTVASPTNVCQGGTVNLSLSNATTGTGVSYQWQYSTDNGVSWINFGSNTETPIHIPTVTTQYHCLVSCTGNIPVISGAVTVDVLSGNCCGSYAAIYANINLYEEISNVTITTPNGVMNNSSNCYMIAPGPGSILNRYSNFSGYVEGPVASTGQTVSFSLTQTSCSGPGNNFFQLYVDWNQDLIFQLSERVYLQATSSSGNHTKTGSFTVPLNATGGTTRMRVVNIAGTSSSINFAQDVIYSTGETEDYCFTVVTPLCSGQQNPGTAIASTSSLCPGNSVQLSLSNVSGESGVFYQWQYSINGGISWIDFGANGPGAIHSPIVSTQYQCLVSCQGSQPVISGMAAVSVLSGSCCGSYYNSFPSNTANGEISNVTITTSYGTMNNSSDCNTLAQGPGSMLRLYGNYAGYVNGPVAQVGETASFSLTQTTCGSNDHNIFQIHIDWNQDHIFQDSECMFDQPVSVNGNHVQTGTFMVPVNAPGGITRMRITNIDQYSYPNFNYAQNNYGFGRGETEDYCFTVISPYCAAAPAPGNAIASASSVCPGSRVGLSLTNATVGSGVTYQWQYSNNSGTTWTNFGYNSDTAFHSPSMATAYRCLVTCSGNGQTFSGIASVNLMSGACCGNYATCYPSDTWDDEISNVTIITPLGTMNNNSTCLTLAPGPGSIQNRYSNYAGVINGPVAEPGQTISFSLTQTSCEPTPWYNFFQIYIDWNQDYIFQDTELAWLQPAVGYGNNTQMGSFIVPLNTPAGTTRMRIVCVGQGYGMGINHAQVRYPDYGETEDYCFTITGTACTGAPVPGNLVALPTSVCPGAQVSISLSNQITGTAITYQWQNSTDGGILWNNCGAGLPTLLHNPVTTTMYRCMVTCSGYPPVYSGTTTVYTPSACCGNYANNFPTSSYSPDIAKVKILTPYGIMENASVCDALAPGQGSIAGRYSNFTGIINGPTAQTGQSVTLYLTQNCYATLSFFQLYVDWNQDQIFQDTERMYNQSPALSYTFGTGGTFTVPATALAGTTRMRVVLITGSASSSNFAQSATFNYGETEDYCFTVLAPLCSGTPNPGTISVAQGNVVCPGTVVNFSLPVATGISGLGIVFQWQSSTDGGASWNNFGSNLRYALHTPVVNTSYRCIVSCQGSANATTPVVAVSMGGACCGSYANQYPIYTNYEEISNVTITTPFGTMNNSSTCSTLATGPGSIVERYGNYAGVVNGPTAQIGQNITFSVTQTSCGSYSNNNFFQVYVDWNQDQIFQQSEQVYCQPASVNGNHTKTGSFLVPLNALNGTTRMRVMNIYGTASTFNFAQSGTFYYGETEDYCFTVIAPACSATPNPGNTMASSSAVCLGSRVLLSLANLTSGSSVNYQWQYSINSGTNWINFGNNADTASHQPTGTTQYRCVVTCSGFTSVISVPVNVTILTGACCDQYTLNFPDTVYINSVSNSDPMDITNVTVTSPLGSMNSNSNCETIAPGAGSIKNIYSNFASIVGGAVAQTGQTVGFSVTHSQCSPYPTYNFSQIYVDWNQDHFFQDSERVYNQSTYSSNSQAIAGSFTVPVNAIPGVTRLRVICISNVNSNINFAESGYFQGGETEDYCFTVIAPSCSGQPNPGPTLASSSSVCAGSSVNLSLTNATAGSGITYQWQFSTNGGASWNNFGNNYSMATHSPTASTQYRCQVICSGFTSGLSTPVSVSIVSCATTGTGSTINNFFSDYPAPYGNTYLGARHQFLITAAQLHAAGLQAGSSIGSLGFNVIKTNGAGSHDGFQVKVYMTNETDPISNGYHQSGLIAQSAPSNYTPFKGWNQHLFTAPFIWNGLSNLVVETCFQSSQSSFNAQTENSNNLIGATWSRWFYDYAPGVCTNPSTIDSSSTIRPNIQFVYTPVQPCSVNPQPPVTVTASAPSVCSGSLFTLQASSPNPNFIYQWSSTPSGFNAVGSVVSTTITSYTTFNLIAFDPTTQCSIYKFVDVSVDILPNLLNVAAVVTPTTVCSGDTAEISTSVFEGPVLQYCSPVSMNGCMDNDVITSVAFGGINNSTGGCNDPTNINNGWSLWPTPNPVIAAGNTYPISVTTSTQWNDGVSVWIDWNQDHVFEATELVMNSAAHLNPHTSNVFIPASAINGVTRMRVRCEYNTSPATSGSGSCGTTLFGETEDYLITITGGSPPSVYSYLWSPSTFLSSPAISNPVANNITTPVSYSVLVTSAATGCQKTATVGVGVNPLPTPLIWSGGSLVCTGASLTLMLNGGSSFIVNGPNAFSQSAAGSMPPDSTPVIVTATANASNAGTYTVVATNTFGCSAIDTMNVTVGVLPVLQTLNITPESCPGESDGGFQVAVLQGTGSGNASGFLYQTFLNSILYGTGSSVNNLPSATYEVAVTDSYGCESASPHHAVTVPLLPNIPPAITCPADISGNNDPGLCGAVVNYQPPSVSDNCPAGLGSAVLHAGLPPGSLFPIGTNTVTYKVTDAEGATTFCSFDVTITDTEAPTFTSVPANFSACNPISWTIPSGTDNCPGLVVNSNYTPPYNFPPGTTTVTYTATDVYGHQTSVSFDVTVLPPSVDADSITSNRAYNNICNGENISLTVNGGVLGHLGGWKWYAGGCGSGAVIGTGNTITVAPSVTTTYFARAEGLCNNTACISMTVVVSSGPPAGPLTYNTVPAYGAPGVTQTISVNPVPGATFYQWFTNNGQINGVLFNNHLSPVQTVPPTVSATFVLSQQNYQIRVFAGNACGRTSQANTTIRGTVAATTCINGPAAICPGTAYSYSACPIAAQSGNSSVSYQWSLVPASAGTISGSGTNVTVTYNSGFTSAQLCVVGVSSFGLAGPSYCITVTTNAPAPGSITGPVLPCAGATGQAYSITALPNPNVTGYMWSTNIPGATISGSGTSVTANYPGNAFLGNVCVTSTTSNCGNSLPTCLSVTSDTPGTIAFINAPVSGVCSSSNVNYTVSTGANTYVWNLPAGVTYTGASNLNSINLNFGAGFTSGTIEVIGYFDCDPDTATVLVSGNPPPPIITPADICSTMVDQIYTATATSATSYSWTTVGAIGNYCDNPPACSQFFVGGWAPGSSMSITATNACGTSAATTLYENCRISDNGSIEAVLYPNPSNGETTVEFYISVDSKMIIEITDVSGRVIIHHVTNAHSGLNRAEFDLHTLSAGMYLVQMKDENGDNTVLKLSVE